MRKIRVGLLGVVASTLLSSCGESSAKTMNFTKEQVKGCELVSAELVAKTFSVPVERLKQIRLMGCMYIWDDEQHELKASVSMPRAHKDVDTAKNWFANATKNRSVNEAQAELDQVAGRVEFDDKLDTVAKKSMAQIVLKASAAKARVYREVSNLGDEARASEDGSIWLRLANITLIVSAYHGAKQPETQLSGSDVKQMIQLANQEDSEWEAKTASQRFEDSSTLANALLATL